MSGTCIGGFRWHDQSKPSGGVVIINAVEILIKSEIASTWRAKSTLKISSLEGSVPFIRRFHCINGFLMAIVSYVQVSSSSKSDYP